MSMKRGHSGGIMNWKKFREEYGESPEDHFEDPADYQESIGNRFEAKRIRSRRKKIENGELPEDEEEN